jgi:hypothetical protein
MGNGGKTPLFAVAHGILFPFCTGEPLESRSFQEGRKPDQLEEDEAAAHDELEQG